MSIDEEEKFWMNDPWVLISNASFLPKKCMSQNEQLNSLTRLSILLSIIMKFMKNQNWLYFLLISILVIVFIKFTKGVENFSITPLETNNNNNNNNIIELDAFEDTRGENKEHVFVNPVFSEEWQINPNIFPEEDLFGSVGPNEPFSGFEQPTRADTPYSQYLSRTNLLPSDEAMFGTLSSKGKGSQQWAREYANSAFTRNTIAHRNDMMSIYKKSLNRRFQNNCNDTFSPFHSF